MEGCVYGLIFPLSSTMGFVNDKTGSIFIEIFKKFSSALQITFGFGAILTAIVIVALIEYLIFIIQSWLASDMQYSYIKIWRKRLFYYYLKARWEFIVSSRPSDFVNNIIQETNRLGWSVYLILQIVSVMIAGLIYLFLCIIISWQVTLILIGSTVLFLPVTKWFISRSHKLGEEINRLNSDLQFESHEFFSGIKVIKATSSEESIIEKFSSTLDRYKDLLFRSAFIPNVMLGISKFLGVVILVTIVFVSVKIFRTDPTGIAVIIIIFFRFVPRAYSLQENLSLLFTHLPAISVLKDSAKEAASLQEDRGKDGNGLRSGTRFGSAFDLKAENVTFSYPNGKIALCGVSIKADSGMTTAIVGSSGSGKSTLVDCLLCLIRPSGGNIHISGVPLKEITPEALRKVIGYVGQDTFLFNDTIANNIAFGSGSADPKEIEEKARTAGAHDFIMKLPERYNTIVGDRGIRLSGGERQRIGLARALMSSPKILLLDEPTSSLDAESERYVQKSIDSLFGKITIIIVTHRFSAVKRADYIYVLEDGRVAEEGSWEKLLQLDGRFKYLWDLQKG
jgi:ABC-type multidrug transport system fused ATPase/permease subunit